MLAQPSPETDTATEFDLGPLSWVHGEIGQALARGMELLATFRAEPSDATALKQARNHVHQAAGAIQMVGLDGAVVYADEIERQLARLEELAPAEIGPACAQIDRACRLLRIFLDEIVGGSPPVPLKLFPEYEALQRARGIRSATPTDLFFPELALRAPVLEAHDPVPEDRLPSHLVKQRRIYQSGLLLFLRGDPEGARGMRAAVAGIERASTRERARTFWWTVGAFYDAIIARGLEPGLGVKQLAGRIDLQIRRLVEGSTKVADRLRREVLYYVAISKPVAPSVQAVQKGFGLARLIPSADVLNADLVRLQPILRDTRERLAAARELWLKVASGRADSLPKLKQTLAEVRANAAEFGNEPLCKLTAALGERLDRVPAAGSVPEPVAMDYATGILLAESAVENFGNLSSEFPGQVDAMLARLEERTRRSRCGTKSRRRCSTKCPGARRSACCSRTSRARFRRICGAWNRCSTPSSATTRSVPTSRRSKRKAGRSAAPSRSSARTTPSACSPCARSRSTATRIRTRWSATWTSSSSPSRSRVWASSSRPSSSSGRIGSG